MAMKYLMATLLSGEKVVSGFDNLGGTGQGYATQVFACVKPFNAWRKVGNVHPQSGETVNIRTRVMYSGAQIASVQQVKPKAGFEDGHEYVADNFEPVAEIQHGQYGVYLGTGQEQPTAGVLGAEYPVHRDEASFRRFVILKVGTPTEPEARFYLDAPEDVGAPVVSDEPQRPSRRPSRGPADADEDLDD
jgi:hypothetical protein